MSCTGLGATSGVFRVDLFGEGHRLVLQALVGLQLAARGAAAWTITKRPRHSGCVWSKRIDGANAVQHAFRVVETLDADGELGVLR